MTIQAVVGQPGLYRDTDTGQIINVEKFRPFETALKIESEDYEWAWRPPVMVEMLLMGWRFTVAQWPEDGEFVQQVVMLRFQGQTIASRSLQSILTSAAVPEPKRDKECEVFQQRYFRSWTDGSIHLLFEKKVVANVGLRLHLYGRQRNPTE